MAVRQFLVVSTLCEEKPGLIGELARPINLMGCSIESSRMRSFGKHTSIVLFVSGSWDAIAKLEGTLKALAKTLNITLDMQRSEPLQHDQTELLAYIVEVIAVDKPGVIDRLTNFFAEEAILITEVSSNSQVNSKGTKIATLYMRAHIPSDVQISELRDNFITICDELNIDAVLEPDRT